MMLKRLGLLLSVSTLFAGGCTIDSTGPELTGAKWRWGEPLGTGGGWNGCGESNITVSNAMAAPVLDCLEEPTAFVNCTPGNVAFGQLVICTAGVTFTSPSDYIDVLSWEFDGYGASVQRYSSSFSWAGEMVTSGTVKVTIMVNDDMQHAYSYVTVGRRAGWTWAGSVTGAQGAPGDLDSCMGGGLGITSGLSCTGQDPAALYSPISVQQTGGFTATQVSDNGPNHGVWYVDSPSARADVRTQVNKEYRADGATHAMTGDPLIVGLCGSSPARNHDSVNRYCGTVASGFVQFVAFDWAHEGRHLSNILPAATQSGNDVYALWEPLVAMNASGLRSAAEQVYQGSFISVHQAGASSHTGNNVTFNFWRWQGQWSFAPMTVAD